MRRPRHCDPWLQMLFDAMQFFPARCGSHWRAWRFPRRIETRHRSGKRCRPSPHRMSSSERGEGAVTRTSLGVGVGRSHTYAGNQSRLRGAPRNGLASSRDRPHKRLHGGRGSGGTEPCDTTHRGDWHHQGMRRCIEDRQDTTRCTRIHSNTKGDRHSGHE